MLLLVSMVMLTASVLPHHHHREILCLQHDVTACEHSCEDETHQDGSCCSHENQACKSCCVTHFRIITPDRVQDDASPDYSTCQLLYSLADILSLSLPHATDKAKIRVFYSERLHPTTLPRVMGLRAPPSV